jgi:hypothetical protein
MKLVRPSRTLTASTHADLSGDNRVKKVYRSFRQQTLDRYSLCNLLHVVGACFWNIVRSINLRFNLIFVHSRFFLSCRDEFFGRRWHQRRPIGRNTAAASGRFLARGRIDRRILMASALADDHNRNPKLAHSGRIVGNANCANRIYRRNQTGCYQAGMAVR